jgi:splicing factor 3A subunit 3
MAQFRSRMQTQSARLREIYDDAEGERSKELQSLNTGDTLEKFYAELSNIKEFHRRYPNEPVENLERAYKRRQPADGEFNRYTEVDNMFTGEEAYGRFFDLTRLHEDYLNLPGVKGTRRITYLQYLDTFDSFTPPQCPIKRPEKMTDAYFRYVGDLASYLESFIKKIKPLENLDKLFEAFDKEFDEAWSANKVEGWSDEPKPDAAGPADGEGIWCADCEKEFKNANVYKAHLNGKKHVRAAEARKARGEADTDAQGASSRGNFSASRLKERAIAEREFRVQKLAGTMQTERSDTRANVERKQGMTDRERQQELAAMFAESTEPAGQEGENESDSDGEEKIYNPLKLPLAWDGKPIPFWLYKLHGLGVEFPCEVCGNYVYQGRRSFSKHFSEARHTHGLKCLGITNTTLFRDITRIEDAQNLWDKIQRDKKSEKKGTENVVQMEDAEGNVMPEKVYYDLQKQGLL